MNELIAKIKELNAALVADAELQAENETPVENNWPVLPDIPRKILQSFIVTIFRGIFLPKNNTFFVNYGGI